MPPIAIACPCGKQYEVDPVHAGKVLACTGCGRSIPIPGGSAPRGKPPAEPCARHPHRAATAGVCTSCRASLCAECLRTWGYYCSAACKAAGKKHVPSLAPTISEAHAARAERGFRAARKVVPALVALAGVFALVTLARWALREQGRELWRYDPGATVALMPPGLAGDRVACTTGSGELLLFEPDGALRATVVLGETTTYAPPLSSTKTLFVPVERGLVWFANHEDEPPLAPKKALSREGHRLSQPLVHDGLRAIAVTHSGTLVDGFMRPMWQAVGPPWVVSIANDGKTTPRDASGTAVKHEESPNQVPAGDLEGRALPVQAASGRLVVATAATSGACTVQVHTLPDGPAETVVAAEPGVAAGWATPRGLLLQSLAGLLHVGTDGSTWRAPGATHVGHASDVVLARLAAEGAAESDDDDAPGPVLPWGAPTGPVVALDLATGRERWRLPLPHARTLLAANDRLLVIAEDAVFIATDKPSAREAAQAMGEALGGRWVAPAQPLLVLDAATGAIVQRIEPGGHAAVFDDGRLLVLRIELDPGLVGERQRLRTHLAMHALGTDPHPLWTLDVPGALVSPAMAAGRLYALAGSQWPAPSLDDQPADGKYPPAALVAIGWR